MDLNWTLRINETLHNDTQHKNWKSSCWVVRFSVQLGVVMLSVIMLSVIMLSVIMLSVVAPNDVVRSVAKTNFPNSLPIWLLKEEFFLYIVKQVNSISLTCKY